MSTGPGINQGKTAFVEQYLAANKGSNLSSVNKAWKSAGHEGTLSESLVSKARARLKGAARAGTNAGATEPVPAAEVKAGPTPKLDKKKRASKAEPAEAPARPEGRGARTGPARSAFVQEVLGREPGANVKAINRAWSEAGHEGTISDSIFFKAKRELGQAAKPSSIEATIGATEPETVETIPAEPASKTPARRPKSERAASPAPGAPSAVAVEAPTPETAPTQSKQADGHGRVLHEIEGEIDELMYRLKSLGGYGEVQDALRTARRLLVRSHGE